MKKKLLDRRDALSLRKCKLEKKIDSLIYERVMNLISKDSFLYKVTPYIHHLKECRLKLEALEHGISLS